jgi:hypothetical protein
MTTAQQLIKEGFDIGIRMYEINVIKRGHLILDAQSLALVLEMPLEEVEEIIAKVKLGLI